MQGMPGNAVGWAKIGARMTSVNLARTLTALVAIVALTAVLMLVASAIRGAPLSRLIRSRAASRDP